MTKRPAGKGRSAGASSSSKALRRQPGSFLKGRWFRSTSSSAMAVFSSPRPQRRRLRRRARIQRCTSNTEPSTLGLSRGCAGRAASTAQP